MAIDHSELWDDDGRGCSGRVLVLSFAPSESSPCRSFLSFLSLFSVGATQMGVGGRLYIREPAEAEVRTYGEADFPCAVGVAGDRHRFALPVTKRPSLHLK